MVYMYINLIGINIELRLLQKKLVLPKKDIYLLIDAWWRCLDLIGAWWLVSWDWNLLEVLQTEAGGWRVETGETEEVQGTLGLVWLDQDTLGRLVSFGLYFELGQVLEPLQRGLLFCQGMNLVLLICLPLTCDQGWARLQFLSISLEKNKGGST